MPGAEDSPNILHVSTANSSPSERHTTVPDHWFGCKGIMRWD
uniref:Putative reverse transcriptase/ribonuclease H n=1 Tax=Moniliophthora roreri TaxID=221103 RepID=A0A0W0FKD6_MONRR